MRTASTRDDEGEGQREERRTGKTEEASEDFRGFDWSSQRHETAEE
jgi:hypothetical protein